jgi:D-inositol-3-phosphate glycosyltransferase
MRILFICENYLPHLGGVEVVFKNLAERFVMAGHEVSMLTHKFPETTVHENINGVQVHRVRCLDSRYLFTFAGIWTAVKLARKHDVIQTTSFNGAPLAWLAGKLAAKKVVITVHEIWQGKWRKVTGFSWLKSNLHEFLERCIYWLSYDKYMCVSNATKNDLLRTGIDAGKVITAYNGLDYEFWKPENVSLNEVEEIRNQWPGKFIYFSWGRPGNSKGFEYALRAVPEILKKMPEALFVLMMSPQNAYRKKYNELLAEVEKLEIQNNVKIIASVPHNELRKYVKAADCVVIPSLAEGFGYTTVESCAMGTPVVISNSGSLPEVVSGKHLIFESKNSNDLAKQVVNIAQGEYQKTTPKRFEWDESVKKYLEVYASLNTET